MVYVLIDAVNKSVIGICDDLDNAKQWKDNAVEVGEHRGVNIQSMEISTDKILPLSAVEISGKMSVAGFKLNISTYNPSSVFTDEVSFTMGEKEITFNAIDNKEYNGSILERNKVTSKMSNKLCSLSVRFTLPLKVISFSPIVKETSSVKTLLGL